MKIIKRLSLMSTIFQRHLGSKPFTPWLERFMTSRYKHHFFTPQLELLKFGYTPKYVFNMPMLIISFIGGFIGLCIHLYLNQIYKNQQLVRNKYRIMEQENSSVMMRFRSFLMKIGVSLENNMFLSEFAQQNQGKNVNHMSESILRTQQYRAYMKNKDRKFDFMDIGVMQKFPFPEFLDLK